MPSFDKDKKLNPYNKEKLAKYVEQLEELYSLSETLSRASDIERIYDEVLLSIKKILNVDKAAILLSDSAGALQFKAWLGLSKKYRKAASDHTHWQKSTNNLLPIVVQDIVLEKTFLNLKESLLDEGIRSLAFFPLILKKKIIGKFMIYYKKPHVYETEEIKMAQIIGRHISFVINKRQSADDFLNGIADGITIQSVSGNLIYVNKTAAFASGYESTEDMIKNPGMWLSNFELRDEKGKILKLDNLPGRKVLKKGVYAEEIIQFKNLITGETRWAQVKATPTFDEEGQIQYAVNIIHDITERLELERKKDEFISTASHELKTPIATLKGFTQILEKRTQNETSKYYLSKINGQIDRLSKLVEDLLDVSRIQSGKLKLVKEKFDLISLVKEVSNNTQLITENHKIIVKKGINEAIVYGDKFRIDEVINNLLSNAIKFSPNSDKIVVKTRLENKQIAVYVTDFGIGISDKNIQRVFEPFFQAGSKIRQSFSGLGLGLYISSKIIKEHDGKMWVDSKKGKGTTFCFSVPIKI